MKTLTLKINGRSERVLWNEDRDIDAIARKHTAFESFAALVGAGGGYRPSFYLGGKSKQVKRELITLITRYNSWMQANEDPRRVYQGDFEFTPATTP